MVSLAVQVNGKVRDRIQVAANVDEETVKALALQTEGARRHIADKALVSVIVVPGRLVNVVVK
jgi:leucyl-tRNA synthetase